MVKESRCDNCLCLLDKTSDWTFFARLPYPTSQVLKGESGIVCSDCDSMLSMFITMVSFDIES